MAVLPVGPIPGVKYPIEVLYCGECSMPIEYCEYYSNAAKCKEWLMRHLPEEFEKRVNVIDDGNTSKDGEAAGGGGESGTAGGEEEKKRQKRGGKGVIRTKKKIEKERHIQLSRQVYLISNE